MPRKTPKVPSMAAVRQVALKDPDHQRKEIAEYVEWQVNKSADTDHKVVHLERIKSDNTEQGKRSWLGPSTIHVMSENLNAAVLEVRCFTEWLEKPIMDFNFGDKTCGPPRMKIHRGVRESDRPSPAFLMEAHRRE